MGANCAGIYGAQLFRQDDRPRYRRGFTVNICILALGLGLAVIRYIDDRVRKVRKRRGGDTIEREATDSDNDNPVQESDKIGVRDDKVN